jgi:hypothetical protein
MPSSSWSLPIIFRSGVMTIALTRKKINSGSDSRQVGGREGGLLTDGRGHRKQKKSWHNHEQDRR